MMKGSQVLRNPPTLEKKILPYYTVPYPPNLYSKDHAFTPKFTCHVDNQYPINHLPFPRVSHNTHPVNFPLKTIRNPNLYMFQLEDPSYLIRLSARAT